MSRVITLPLLNEYVSETPGAQLLATKFPIKFPASSSYTLGSITIHTIFGWSGGQTSSHLSFCVYPTTFSALKESKKSYLFLNKSLAFLLFLPCAIRRKIVEQLQKFTRARAVCALDMRFNGLNK